MSPARRGTFATPTQSGQSTIGGPVKKGSADEANRARAEVKRRATSPEDEATLLAMLGLEAS